MECNKDEASRAKEIAERKFSERNYSAAKKFVLKAKNLYPDLDGLSQMLSTLDVYISADTKIGGDPDWYGVLGVSPLSDDEMIRKQYRRLALMLHPDKNKAFGAEGAFKLVSEAWGLLSDKSKRQSYNEKRNSGFGGGFQHKPAPAKPAGPSSGGGGGPASNGYNKQKKNPAAPKAPTQQNNVASFSVATKKSGGETFWTICNRCKTHYEYMRIYLNHTLLCPNCHEAFAAVERDPPPNVFKQSNWTSRKQVPPSKPPPPPPPAQIPAATAPPPPPPPQSGVSTNFQWGLFSQAAGDRTSPAATQAASVVKQASETVKRQREERERTHHQFTDRPTKKPNNAGNDHHANGFYAAAANGNPGLDARKTTGLEASRVFVKPNGVRELSFPELKNILMHKAKRKIVKMLLEWKEESNGSDKKQRRAERVERETTKSVDAPAAVPINVPDSDFHNFDSDRTGDSFKEEQVWAAFDDDDGMPRFYARIHKVVSVDPFRIRISWLNSRSNGELGPMDWIGRGFAKTCGEFRVGKHESSGTLNSFSHRVRWEKGPRGSIRIYPKKGEVWALYKNWSSDWDEKTPDEVIHKYEMVEVAEDFDEERGTVSITPLHKVPGFKTVFRSDPKDEVRSITREEMFRLSHQVPYHVLTGQEAENAPKGCLELDPAATPLELIQPENGNGN